MSRVLTFLDRPSDSPFVDRIWRSRSERGGKCLSIAQSHFEIAVTRHRGRTFVTLRGPETTATTADCPVDGEVAWHSFQAGRVHATENADTVVARLARKGVIARDFVVEAMLQDRPLTLPLRSMQRHFVRATGITHRTLRLIERARHATMLLTNGVPILDTVHVR